MRNVLEYNNDIAMNIWFRSCDRSEIQGEENDIPIVEAQNTHLTHKVIQIHPQDKCNKGYTAK